MLSKLLPMNENGDRIAGDVRAGENPALAAIHTIFHR